MTEGRIIAGSLVDVRNVGTHKSVKLTIHVPEEHAMQVMATFGWPTGVHPISVAIARLDPDSVQRPAPLPAVEAPRPVPPIPIPAGAAREIIFTCLKCEANYNVDEETNECPVCFWKRNPEPAKAAKEPRRFTTQPYAQQAALRCNDPVYWAFLRETCPHAGPHVRSIEDAKIAVRILCDVDSRADIKPDTEAETKWLELEQWFSAWKTKERAMA